MVPPLRNVSEQQGTAGMYDAVICVLARGGTCPRNGGNAQHDALAHSDHLCFFKVKAVSSLALRFQVVLSIASTLSSKLYNTLILN